MSARARLLPLRRRLVLFLVLRATLSAAGAGLGVALLLAMPARIPSVPLAVPGGRILLPAAAAALLTLGVLLWRGRFIASLARVALWVEEQAPELRYALVTALEERHRDALEADAMRGLARVDMTTLLRRAARSLLAPLGAAAALGGALALLPPSLPASAPPLAAGAAAGASQPPVVRLAPLQVAVAPPAYAAGVVAAEVWDDPTAIAALVGSNVRLSGPGVPEGLEARLDGVALTPVADSAGAPRWAVRFTLPKRAGLLELRDGDSRRLVVLDPRPDAQPRAELLLPARDTTLREASGRLTVEARLSDDLELARGWVEYIVASGEGEGNFTHREGRLAVRTFAGLAEATLRLEIPLADFALRPGDVLSVRAAAEDRNTLGGPGIGHSETRRLRLARPGEYDSLAIEGAPPAVDSTLMTLRYLIVLSEELHERRERLARATFVDSSVALGRRAEGLRDRVRALQADQTMGGLFSGNPILDTAYLALAEGSGALRVAEPGAALAPLREALRVLEVYARAERHYTRGGTPDVLVDLARVRLAGAERGAAQARTPRPPPTGEAERARLRERFAEALTAGSRPGDASLDGLLRLQAEALAADPALAAAVGEAIAALRSGGDADALLAAVRRRLDGETAASDSLPAWSGAW